MTDIAEARSCPLQTAYSRLYQARRRIAAHRQTSRAEARSRCGADWSIQGGKAVMGQWVEQQRDQNITCPGIAADLGQWFHRLS